MRVPSGTPSSDITRSISEPLHRSASRCARTCVSCEATVRALGLLRHFPPPAPSQTSLGFLLRSLAGALARPSLLLFPPHPELLHCRGAPRVTLGTSVLILPYRNPVVLAKMLATIDQLSGGRLIVGVGGGWMTEEFAALGASFPARGTVSDECLRLMRETWSHTTVSFSGHYTSFQDMQVSPPPAQPQLPIWVGGVSPRAGRRTAEFGDGWACDQPHR